MPILCSSQLDHGTPCFDFSSKQLGFPHKPPFERSHNAPAFPSLILEWAIVSHCIPCPPQINAMKTIHSNYVYHLMVACFTNNFTYQDCECFCDQTCSLIDQVMSMWYSLQQHCILHKDRLDLIYIHED